MTHAWRTPQTADGGLKVPQVSAMLGIVTLALAQTLVPAAIPVEEEPRHHLSFSNELVRVFDLRFPPGYQSLNHAHARDHVAITISVAPDDPEERMGQVAFAAGGYAHVVTNPTSRERRFIDVEILTGDRPEARAVFDEPEHRLELENARVRIYRIILDPGDSLPVHTHAAGWIAVTVAGSIGPGTSRWFDAGAANPITAGQYPLEVVEVEPR